MPLFRRGTQKALRVLAASARRLDLEDKSEARRLRAVRQGWQADAWNYRDSITELRYAIAFKANSAARMRLFVGVEPEVGESENPLPLAEATGIPEGVASIAGQALADLARNEGERRTLLKTLSTNLDVAGECFTLGQTDPQTGEETWSIRSLDEIVAKDDGWELRQIPDGPQGVIPWVKLDPELAVVSRVWVPHPRFGLLADSPLRSMLQEDESLLLMRRMIRAEARSRTSRGILLIPDELSLKVPTDDNDDPEADPFFSGLTRALIEPIGDEGVASAVAPIVVRGPAEMLDKVRLLDLGKPFEEEAARIREELVGNIATGFDLPKEVITGVADLNHWSAWQVDDNTFRHHLEPHIITMCDSLTAGYFRLRLEALGVPPEYARRLVIWYDPTELVTHPDQTKDAQALYDRHAISASALARISGFSEDDLPSPEETVVRMLQNMRTPPANLVMAAVHQLFPTLTIPPIETAGAVPGVKPSGVDVGEPEAPIPGQPQLPAPTVDDAPPATEPAEHGEPGPPAVTASAHHAHHRLSRKLTQIDRDLRARLQTAANAAMLKQLERVGGRLRAKVAKDETLRTRIAHRRNERVSAILGPDVVRASGVDAEGLMGEDWGTLRGQFHDWTQAAQQQSLNTARQLAGLEEDDPRVRQAEQKMQRDRDKGWELLATALSTLGAHLLYNPDPNVGPTDWADLNPDTLVQTGLIRAAIGVAGGGDYGIDTAGNATIPLGEPIGQVGTGATIQELLESAQMTTEAYEWEHGPSLKPFEPHLALDGAQFASFDDEQLANTEGWPDNQYFMPGDHGGCTCDATPLWVPAATEGSNE